MEDIAMTSPLPVDMRAMAPMVSTRMPPADPSTVSAISGVTRPKHAARQNVTVTTWSTEPLLMSYDSPTGMVWGNKVFFTNRYV